MALSPPPNDGPNPLTYFEHQPKNDDKSCRQMCVETATFKLNIIN